MKSQKKIMTVFGTRPEAIKMAPLVMQLNEQTDNLTQVVVSTGQHDEMLKQVLKTFNIHEDYDLKIMKPDQTLSSIISSTVEGLAKIVEKEKPDMMLVQGDTSTAFAASLVAFYSRCTLGHIEAGLRTFDKWRPYPEEINRQLITRLADLHFAPTKGSKKNLLHEHIDPKHIFVTGNTVIDAFLEICKRKLNINKFPFKLHPKKKIVLVTAHRRENFGLPLEQISLAINDLAETFKNEIQIVVPMHKNPRVRQILNKILGKTDNIILCEPLGYELFAHLIKMSYLILTDSGGIQEEAPSLGIPVLVLREKTERPEAVLAKTVKLIGHKRENIYNQAKALITSKKDYNAMAKAVNPYGDGKAVDRIIKIILNYYGFNKTLPKEFVE